MSEKKKSGAGRITWFDLTVENSEIIRDFYSAVVGWQAQPVSMGSYYDYNMNAPDDGQTVTGICHARGVNADLPARWLIYITVENLDMSAAECTRLGGKIVTGPKEMSGHGRCCIILDPAGAAAAMYEPTEQVKIFPNIIDYLNKIW